jgi:diguanylate cyclase (GGDEF)-like protein/PAS domain S-box-containing protein
MFIDLLNNLALTSVFLVLGGKYFDTNSGKQLPSSKSKYLIGILTGVLGVLLMANAFRVSNDVIVDLRYLAILLAALYGGGLSALLSSVIVGIGRLTIYGISTTSIIGSILCLIIGIFYAYITFKKLSNIDKHVYMNVFGVALLSVFIYLLVNNPTDAIIVFVYYWPISLIAGYFTYFVAEYIKKFYDNSRYLARFREIAENSTDLISIHSFWGKYLYVSPSCKSILQYDAEELMGKFPNPHIHPEDFPSLQNAFFDVIRSSKELTVRYRMKQKNGNYIWLETAVKKMKETKENRDELICISRDITERKQIQEELKEKNRLLENLSNYDSLTEIPNRRYFDRKLEIEWNKAVENGTPISLILFDIDFFKKYNDTYGHQQGDECLKMVAKTGQSILPQSSMVIARFGGEEFVVLLPEMSQYGAFKVADSLRKTIQALAIPHERSSVGPVVTISVGVSTSIPKKDDNAQELLKQSDQALYKAKAAGKNRVDVYKSLT